MIIRLTNNEQLKNKQMSFKMNGSPATTGGIQGTSSHASALKKVEWNKKLQRKTDKRKRLEDKKEKREDKGKGTKRIDRRLDRNQDKINKEYYKLNPKNQAEVEPTKPKSEVEVKKGGKNDIDGDGINDDIQGVTKNRGMSAPTKMYDSPAQSHEKGHKGTIKKSGEIQREILRGFKKGSSDRTELSDKKENKRNKLINKRTKLKDKGKEKETSGKLRRTQNKINKLDGSKVRHKKGFLGLGKYKEVKKD